MPLTTVLDAAVVAPALALLPLLVRQKMSSLQLVRGFVILGYLLLAIWACLDFANLLIATRESGLIYTLVGAPAILLSTLPLTIASVMISRPKAGERGDLEMGSTKTHIEHRFLAVAYTTLLLLTIVALWVFAPFTLQLIPLDFGGSVFHPSFDGWYVAIITLIAATFVLYPCRLVIARSRTASTKKEAREMLLLPITWIAAATLLVGLRLYFPPATLESRMASAVGVAVFGISAYIFRRSDVLAAFVLPHPASVSQISESRPFTRRLRLNGLEDLGRLILLEYDRTQPYEREVKDYVDEAKAAFTVVILPITSPLRLVLKSMQNVTMFLLNGNASDAVPPESGNEFIIPENDRSLLLSTLQNSIYGKDGQVSIIFAQLSDVLVASSIKEAYSFLKQCVELVVQNDSRGLFLLGSGAAGKDILAMVRSLFSVQIRRSLEGLKLTKLGAR